MLFRSPSDVDIITADSAELLPFLSEPENFSAFLRVSGSHRSLSTVFAMELGSMEQFFRRCLASQPGFCPSSLYFNQA